jgi:hypothetical protein
MAACMTPKDGTPTVQLVLPASPRRDRTDGWDAPVLVREVFTVLERQDAGGAQQRRVVTVQGGCLPMRAPAACRRRPADVWTGGRGSAACGGADGGEAACRRIVATACATGGVLELLDAMADVTKNTHHI